MKRAAQYDRAPETREGSARRWGNRGDAKSNNQPAQQEDERTRGPHNRIGRRLDIQQSAGVTRGREGGARQYGDR